MCTRYFTSFIFWKNNSDFFSLWILNWRFDKIPWNQQAIFLAIWFHVKFCIFLSQNWPECSQMVSLTSPSKALKNVKTHSTTCIFLREDKWFFGKNWLCWSKNAVLMGHYHSLVSEGSSTTTANYKKLVCSSKTLIFSKSRGNFEKDFFFSKFEQKIPSII